MKPIPRKDYKPHQKYKTGTRVGRLTLLRDTKRRINSQVVWLCRCDCGNEVELRCARIVSQSNPSCGCYFADRSRKALLKEQWANYRTTAKQKNHTFDITIPEFHKLIMQNCAYCGTEPLRFVWKPPKNSGKRKLRIGHMNGLDRINTKLGYEKGNVAPCCKHCNRAKWTFTPDEFKKWVKKAYEHLYPVDYGF